MQNLKGLMKNLNIEKYPERWALFYDDVMNKYGTEGCAYTNPSYYEKLHQKYSCFDKYLNIYMKGAEAVGKNDELTRFLMLLCHAIKDRRNFKEDLKNFNMPKAKDGVYSFEHEILPGLAFASMTDFMYENMAKRGIPRDLICETVKSQQNGVKEYMRRNSGKAGYLHFGWNQLYIDGELFRIGSLEYQINYRFIGRCIVFADNNGNQKALAHDITLHKSGYELGSKNFEDEIGSRKVQIEETETDYEGYPVLESGYIGSSKTVLSKKDWTPILKNGDCTVSVHIPSETDFTSDSIDESIHKARDFFKKYYPQYRYKAFICVSWLMDSALQNLLRPDSNIVSFNKRFKKLTTLSYGEGVLGFVFLKNPEDVKIEELPENTGLEKTLKNYYLSGKVIYEMIGYFTN